MEVEGTPTWSHNGILCICNIFTDMVKVTFINGAKLGDVDGVFNAELGGNKWRALKIFQADKVNASERKKLLLAAVAFNAAKGNGEARPSRLNLRCAHHLVESTVGGVFDLSDLPSQ